MSDIELNGELKALKTGSFRHLPSEVLIVFGYGKGWVYNHPHGHGKFFNSPIEAAVDLEKHLEESKDA